MAEALGEALRSCAAAKDGQDALRLSRLAWALPQPVWRCAPLRTLLRAVWYSSCARSQLR
jgi:hypothetical protein